ncbi:MAG: SOS response-associated peptidase [Proteobacteria bacterium]|nr:SOS response-associated peptidase [Pseudomonadota bacterium]
MCEKITQQSNWAELAELAEILGQQPAPLETTTPMRFASVIRLNAQGKRESARLRWGLVTPSERDPNLGSKFIHARAETIDSKPTFRDAFAKRRGLLVVRTFNEGEDVGSKTRQYIVTPRDGKPLAIAVIWERWHDPRGIVLDTFAMVTVPANALLSTITDRMPAMVADEDWKRWLGEEPASVEELKQILKTVEGDWDMQPADAKKEPAPEKPKKSAAQGSLF